MLASVIDNHAVRKVAIKTIHKPSLDHNMIVTKVGMTLGP
jgi:hypothetical protein